jgi:hypothetical protein
MIDVLCGFPEHPGERRDINVKSPAASSSYILSNSTFIHHPTILFYRA